MKITDIKIRKKFDANPQRANNVLAIVSVTVENQLALHDIKIIRTQERTFAAMPSRRDEYGVFHDIFHPVNAETRTWLEHSIIEAYNDILQQEELDAAFEAASDPDYQPKLEFQQDEREEQPAGVLFDLF